MDCRIKTGNYCCCCGNNSGQHKTVIQNILPDFGCSGTVELYGSKQGRISRDKKVTIYSRENTNQESRSQSQRQVPMASVLWLLQPG